MNSKAAIQLANSPILEITNCRSSRSRRRFMANRQYELVYILPPDTTEDQVGELHGQLDAVVSRMNGQIEKTENWGRRKLAYEIGHNKEGVYVHQTVSGCGDLMTGLDRRLRLMDQVVRDIV